MKITGRIKKMIYFTAFLILVAAIIFSLYYASLPQKYSLRIGDASPYDINAIRSVTDTQETIRRANAAALEVPDIMIENPEIKSESLENISEFYSAVRNVRIQYQEAVQPDETQPPEQEEETVYEMSLEEAALLLSDSVYDKLELTLETDFAIRLIELEEAAFDSFYDNTTEIAGFILSRPVTREALAVQIQGSVIELSERMAFFSDDTDIIEEILSMLLKSNLEYDREATVSAKQLAFDTVMANPVMIPRGTRILNFGETVTYDKYMLISEMDLLETGEFDFRFFWGISLLVIIIFSIILVYTSKHEKNNINTFKDKLSLFVAMIIPFALSLMLINISSLTFPVYISAVLITAYFGFRSGILMSFLLAFLILPITEFDPKFLLVTMLGCIVASLFTMGISKRNNYALIIISTAMTCFLGAVAFNILIRSTMRDTFTDAGFAVLGGAVSVIFALGAMPLFEMIFNSVSPLRLIELSQPGNPLLRRLFIEAPGTSQHSVMVGNLAEAGAQAIGANSLIARVGAYYHDIGKLENPEMFIENQEGINPHDKLSPEESSSIIIAHPEAGLRIGKKYKLPETICKMIYEHHGNATQMFFYRRAQEIAKEKGNSVPDAKNFIYNTPRPSSKESGILMLADTVEAAMKSSDITNLNEAEAFIRTLIKQKIQEEQLTDSGLSFKDIEDLIQAFLHVYSGHFRTRVRYPDDTGNIEQSKKT